MSIAGSIINPGDKPLPFETMLRVIVESPCRALPTSTFSEHAAYAQRAVRDCLSKNEAPLASHLLLAFTHTLDEDDEDERIVGTNAGWAWIPHCDKLVVYNDYGITEGMVMGIRIAQLHGIPISYRQLGKNENPAS